MSSWAGNFPTDLKIKYVFIKSLPLCWGMRHCLLVEHLPSMHKTLDSKQRAMHQELNQTDTIPQIHSGMLFSLYKPCLGNNKKILNVLLAAKGGKKANPQNHTQL